MALQNEFCVEDTIETFPSIYRRNTTPAANSCHRCNYSSYNVGTGCLGFGEFQFALCRASAPSIFMGFLRFRCRLRPLATLATISFSLLRSRHHHFGGLEYFPSFLHPALTLVQTMPRKRSAVGVVDGTTSVSSSASTDFVAPGGGSRADLEHLASTLGLSVDACLAIMNCEGQVRHFILLVSSYYLHALPGYFDHCYFFFMRNILFIIYIISFLIVVLQNNL